MTRCIDLPGLPFTLAQARARGLTRYDLARLVRQRDVRRVLRNVYVRADVPDTIDLRTLAASLVHPLGIISDRFSAWIHGVDVFEYRELEILPDVETVVLRGGSRIRRSGCRGGRRDLVPGDVMEINGMQVLTPLRTAMDLGCSLSRRNALAALDGFMRVHGITQEQLYGELPRYRRRRGVIQLRELIPLADPRAESPGESWTRLEINDAGIPAPEPQYWVKHRGRKLYRLDLAYPKSKVCVEYDGREFHDDDELRRERDRKRRKWLRDHGWTVIVVDKDSFTNEALYAWLGELREALRLAA
ncbi:MAG TPA: type IV toxin-antitoxin system AbiEi family antitoxin domain-containing protein [Nocardioidaceae bacterium]|nr:type IV toxin-antitoxin system AbiEi family antitoxin domain-containing protein [Nocardioidaceae bacterium]